MSYSFKDILKDDAVFVFRERNRALINTIRRISNEVDKDKPNLPTIRRLCKNAFKEHFEADSRQTLYANTAIRREVKEEERKRKEEEQKATIQTTADKYITKPKKRRAKK